MIEEKYIGCSGYYYDHWRINFYPEDLPKYKWLEYYSERFKTVEINNSFYRIPADSAIKKWYDITPAGFIFTMKGNRYITHVKKLNIDDSFKDTLDFFLKKVRILKEKLGCVLWQYPPSFKVNFQRLEAFCQLLPSDMQHVMEFRTADWFTLATYEILEKYNIAFCMLSSPYLPEEPIVTSEVAYLRFHGKSEGYKYLYTKEDLEEWELRLMDVNAKKLYAYFNNDFNANAANNALTFAEMMKAEPAQSNFSRNQ